MSNELRTLVQVAHLYVQHAQDAAYKDNAPWRIRFALNRAQNILIKLLVHDA